MILQLTINTDCEKLKQCICAAWQKAYDEELKESVINPFEVGEKVMEADLIRMLAGSCLGELCKDGCVMEVVE